MVEIRKPIRVNVVCANTIETDVFQPKLSNYVQTASLLITVISRPKIAITGGDSASYTH